MQLQVKTILNAIQHFPGFVYQDIRLSDPVPGQARERHISLVEQAGRPAQCSRCQRPAPGDDRLPARAWLFIPLWGLVTRFFYAARRVQWSMTIISPHPLPHPKLLPNHYLMKQKYIVNY